MAEKAQALALIMNQSNEDHPEALENEISGKENSEKSEKKEDYEILEKIYNAVKRGKLKELQELLKSKQADSTLDLLNTQYSINDGEKPQKPFTLLELASKFGHLEMVKFLIAQGAVIEYGDTEGQVKYCIAQNIAKQYHHIKVYEFFMELNATLLYPLTKTLVRKKKNLEGIKEVACKKIAEGFSVNFRIGPEANSLLHLTIQNAIQHSEEPLIPFLIEQGASLLYRNKSGRSPLEMLLESSRLKNQWRLISECYKAFEKYTLGKASAAANGMNEATQALNLVKSIINKGIRTAQTLNLPISFQHYDLLSEIDYQHRITLDELLDFSEADFCGGSVSTLDYVLYKKNKSELSALLLTGHVKLKHVKLMVQHNEDATEANQPMKETQEQRQARLFASLTYAIKGYNFEVATQAFLELIGDDRLASVSSTSLFLKEEISTPEDWLVAIALHINHVKKMKESQEQVITKQAKVENEKENHDLIKFKIGLKLALEAAQFKKGVELFFKLAFNHEGSSVDEGEASHWLGMAHFTEQLAVIILRYQTPSTLKTQVKEGKDILEGLVINDVLESVEETVILSDFIVKPEIIKITIDSPIIHYSLSTETKPDYASIPKDLIEDSTRLKLSGLPADYFERMKKATSIEDQQNRLHHCVAIQLEPQFEAIIQGKNAFEKLMQFIQSNENSFFKHIKQCKGFNPFTMALFQVIRGGADLPDRTKMIQYLLKEMMERQISIDICDELETSRYTPLMFATADQDVALVQILLKAKADPYLEFQNHEPRFRNLNNNAFTLALITGNMDLISCFLGYHPDLSKTRNSQGMTPFMLACAQAKPDIIKFILSKDLSLASEQDLQGMNAFLYAVVTNNIEAMQFLIDEKFSGLFYCAADINGCTALHHAVLKGHVEAFALILKLFPKLIEQRDVLGMTPLHHAAKKCDIGMTRGLLEAGANLCRRDFAGKTAVDYACANGGDIARLLGGVLHFVHLVRGLGKIAEVDCSVQLKTMLEAYPVNLRYKKDNTLLHLALGSKSQDPNKVNTVALSLILKGANLLAKNAQGKTPMETGLSSFANFSTCIEAVKLFSGQCQSKTLSKSFKDKSIPSEAQTELKYTLDQPKDQREEVISILNQEATAWIHYNLDGQFERYSSANHFVHLDHLKREKLIELVRSRKAMLCDLILNDTFKCEINEQEEIVLKLSDTILSHQALHEHQGEGVLMFSGPARLGVSSPSNPSNPEVLKSFTNKQVR